MTDDTLSVIIPARNEQFLARTIQDLLANIRGNTDIIAVLDGDWADPSVEDNERVTLVYLPESVGQRAATNIAARISQAKYVMKCDAHCAFDEGFDVKMMEVMQPDWTFLPTMRNLHIFNWVCKNGHTRYQGPSGECRECGEPTMMDVVWIPKRSPQSRSYCFDSTPHFQYFGEFNKRPEGQNSDGLTESMSIQGSCFMLTREKYFELDVCEEAFGMWGSQGIEVACKTWLSGGRVVVNHNTWYAHCFRTQGGDFGFPYSLSGRQVDNAKKYARELFFENKWHKQVYPLSWLVEKFYPVKGWTEEQLAEIKKTGESFKPAKVHTISASKVVRSEPSKGIIYYSDCQLDSSIAEPVRANLQKISTDLNIPIVSATLKKMDFGVKNICFPSFKRGYLSMFKQIRAALEHSQADIIYHCEHDVLYHPSHFDFIPPEEDKFYYNINFWKIRYSDGHALHYDACQTLGLVAYRKLLLAEYNRIIEQVERDGFSTKTVSFEPGSRNGHSETFRSDVAILDIRHDHNLTSNRWREDQFRDKRTCQSWQEADEVPGWGITKGRMKEILRDIGIAA